MTEVAVELTMGVAFLLVAWYLTSNSEKSRKRINERLPKYPRDVREVMVFVETRVIPIFLVSLAILAILAAVREIW